MNATTQPQIVEDSTSSRNPLSGMFVVNWGSQSVGMTLEDDPVQHFTHLLLGH